MPKRKTHEQYIKEVNNLFNDEYTILGRYINSNTKIKIRHNTCNNTYEQIAGSILSGRRCPFCFGTHKTTTKEFQNELDTLYKDEFIVLEEYINAHTPILIKHNICNKEYKVAPHSIRRGAYCRYCSKKATMTKNEFEKQIYNLVGNEYSVIGEFYNTSTKVSLKHNVCGNEWMVLPTHFLYSGSRCPYCDITRKKTHEDFVEIVKKLTGDEYKVLGKYVNISTKIKMKHITCGNEYYVRPCDFIHSMSRCPKCKLSKGEQNIKNFLDKHKIVYVQQKTYETLVSDTKKYLSYDFYLPDYNLLIEYQGQQHEYPVDLFGGEKKFIRQQKFDKQKRDYAKLHNISLLEIWYYNFDKIETILTEKLKLCA